MKVTFVREDHEDLCFDSVEFRCNSMLYDLADKFFHFCEDNKGYSRMTVPKLLMENFEFELTEGALDYDEEETLIRALPKEVRRKVAILEARKWKKLVEIDDTDTVWESLQFSTKELEQLKARCDRAERIVSEIWDMFYGRGMELTNWHLNGDTQPIDSFFEDNDWSIEKEDG